MDNGDTRMALLHRLLISLGLILIVGACENARLSLANTGGQPPGKAEEPEKPDCGGDVSTVGVFDHHGEIIGSMTPWQGVIDPVENYNYRNEAADILIGPKGLPQYANHFFYQTPDGALYLYLILDRFHDFQGDAFVNLRLETVGNGLNDHVVVSDENREMRVVETNKSLEIRTYRGTFEYQEFGDGAVIGPFLGDAWELDVTYEAATELDNLWFADSLVNGLVWPMEAKSLQTMTFRPTVLELCKLPRPESVR